MYKMKIEGIETVVGIVPRIAEPDIFATGQW
jgi:hypothetical protein